MIVRSNHSPSARRSAALVLALMLGALVGCDDSDDGGSGPGRLYFSTANIQECMPMHVDVPLVAAGATVAQRGDGSPDCDVDATLASAGCTGTFELEADGVLAVDIDGCEVPPEANLFDCKFDAGDPAAIGSSVESACTCVGEPICHLNLYCLRFPEICVSENAGPNACEDCFNDIDDDDDTFVDCDDANCYIVDCGVGQTTITCTSTSTTTTTTL
jgi:hypothetical protein